MHFAEKACVTLRHCSALNRARWLWDCIRPVYNRGINLIGRQGLRRKINGTDTILVSPRHRGVPELYEPEVWRHVMSSVRNGDVVVDVGAHFGLYTVALALRVGQTGHVIAFEPDAANYEALRLHLKLNRVELRVQPLPAAAGATDGTVRFT